MGCWNETCMATNLPIVVGEPCVGFLITRYHAEGKTSYPDERYRPISPPIFGLYDDYGCLDDIENADELFNAFSAVNAFEGEPYKNMDEIVRAAERGNLSLKHEYNVGYDGVVHFVLVKRKFFKMAIEMNQKTVDHMKQSLEALKIVKSKLNDPSTENEVRKLTRAILRSTSTFGSTHPFIGMLQEQMVDFSGTAALGIFLNSIRKEWAPTTGAGSQRSIEDDRIVKFYEAVAEEAKGIYLDYESLRENYCDEF